MILLGDEELAALGEEPISRRINSFLSESAAEQATSESSPFQYAILPNTCELDKIQEELRHLELDLVDAIHCYEEQVEELKFWRYLHLSLKICSLM